MAQGTGKKGGMKAYPAGDAGKRRLREEIALIRRDMGDTLEEITGRVSAGNIRERAWQEVKSLGKAGGRAKEKGASLVDMVRENPIPAALASAGLIFLFSKGTRTEYGKYREGEGNEAGGKISEAGAKASHAADVAKEKAADFGERAKERAEHVKESLKYKKEEAKGVAYGFLKDNPLAVVAVAFAIGSALGMALPETSGEHEIAAPAGKGLREEVQKGAEEAKERAGEDLRKAA